jgi:N-acetylmuramoyl-L-alanine amidase
VKVTSVEGRLRAVIALNGMADWTAAETAGSLVLTLGEVKTTNLSGGDDADVVLRIAGDGIGARYLAAADLVKVDDDVKGGVFTFVIPATVTTLGSGLFKTQDTLSREISVLSTSQSNFISIAKQQPDTQFRLVAEADGNALTIRRSVAEAPASVPSGIGRLVVLDAGHGGRDPGAVFDGIYESHINLDIVLRAEALLKAQGINVMLTRRTDVFVGLEERTVIANNANASVFISVHQNSMPAGIRGTMTFYYASSVNGKNYARIMQDTLAAKLGLGDIGLKSSSELIVLRKTKMPAILAELACMSDDQDMAVIKTDAYRTASAQALADGVLKILATMN